MIQELKCHNKQYVPFLEVPESWKVVRLKSLFNVRKGLSITKADLIDDGIKVISYGQLHAKYNTGIHVDDRMYRHVSESFLNTDSASLVKRNDFIISDTSEDLEGLCNFVRIDNDDQIFAGYHTIIMENVSETDGHYLAYLFMTDCWRDQFRCKVDGVKVYSLPQSLLKDGTTILPPIPTQRKITEYLDGECSYIDKMIQFQTEMIEKLEELRKSIICEYTTGRKQIQQESRYQCH